MSEHKTDESKQKKSMSKADTGTSIRRMPNPFTDMDRFFDDFGSWMRPFERRRPSWAHLPAAFEGKMPKVDVVDREKEVVVRAEVPGVRKEDLEVSMSDNTVTIKGTTHREEKEEKDEYFRCEISSGSFTRTVALPCDVDSEKATTRYKDGLLELTVPKVERAKRRTIKVE